MSQKLGESGVVRVFALRGAILAASIAVSIGAIYLAGYGQFLEFNYLLSLVRQVPDNWAVFFLFQLVYVFGSWVLFPLTATTILAIIVFPLWKAVLAALMGTFLSGSVTYLVGRYAFKVEKSKRFKKHLDKVRTELNSYGYWAIAALRLSPQPPFIATSVLSGALRVNFVKYLFATFIGLGPMLILTFVLGKQTLVVVRDPSVVAVFALLGLAILVPLYLVLKKRFMIKRSPKKANNNKVNILGGSDLSSPSGTIFKN